VIFITKLSDGNYGFKKPDNVRKCINFYQHVDQGSLSGLAVWGSAVAGCDDEKESKKENFDKKEFYIFNMKYEMHPSLNDKYGHVEITRYPDVQQKIFRSLRDLANSIQK
jgi:hypothetical protein